MQSKHILTALLCAASSLAQTVHSAEDASTTALPVLNSQQFSRLSKNYGEYLATQSTQSEFIAVNKYFSSVSPESQSEVDREDNSFIAQLRTTQSAKLPAYVTALPSSLQGYASSFLEGVERVIDAAVITTSPSSIGTSIRATSVVSGTQSNVTSSASGSSSSTLATQSSPQNTATTTGTSPSSSSRNAATQPTGALKVVGALAVGMIGLVVVA